MRIGDVGAVSHIGDLLAFSLAVVIVLSLTYGIGMMENDPAGETVDWVHVLSSIRTWKGFDPDGDGILETCTTFSTEDIQSTSFPLEGRVLVTFRSETFLIGFHFVDGEFERSKGAPQHDSMVHGCTVLVEDGTILIPCLMEVSLQGGP
ncbi:MAG: hypothetical protein JXA22_02450 [Candidatus Thermoplasmatota archaeon]|nr:hypothetical protein [Candidatus Thermoplasmatota archaeon]